MSEIVDVPIVAGQIPAYAHPGDAGADLVSTEAVTLPPGGRAIVATGVRVALPEGYALFVAPRSGLAANYGISVANAPGIVDAGYRGEIKVIMLNTDLNNSYEVSVGDRIAQLVIVPVVQANFIPVDDLESSVRGQQGFGSTGYAQ